MKFFNRTDIFICESIHKQKDLLEKIQCCISKESREDKKCTYLDKTQLLDKLSENKHHNIRFACISKKTGALVLHDLFNLGVPIIIIDLDANEANIESENADQSLGETSQSDEESSCEWLDEFCHRDKLDKDHISRMIYHVSHPHEIKGAVKWVHTYYYHLRNKEKKRIKEIQNQIAAETDQIETQLISETL